MNEAQQKKLHKLINSEPDPWKRLEIALVVDIIYNKLSAKAFQKDEHHLYCGAYGKCINLETKPKYCYKCGIHIGE